MPLADVLHRSRAVAAPANWISGLDPGGVPVLVLDRDGIYAEISLNGAHLTAFENRGHKLSMFWMDASRPPAGHAIRGGVPLVFPWFGPHKDRADFPRHGFARNLLWSVAGEFESAGGHGVALELADSALTRLLWPHGFRARLEVSVAETAVSMRLAVLNNGDGPFTYEDCFHPYFAVGDPRSVKVDGLDGVEFLDKVEQFARKRQSGSVGFGGEVDRVFLGTECACVIRELGRTAILVEKSGSRETVVWNPGPGGTGTGAPPFVCVEPANCADHPVTLAPGEEHATSVRFAFDV